MMSEQDGQVTGDYELRERQRRQQFIVRMEQKWLFKARLHRQHQNHTRFWVRT